MEKFLTVSLLLVFIITVIPFSVKAQCSVSLSPSGTYNVTSNTGPLSLDCTITSGAVTPSSYIWQINNITVTGSTDYRFITPYQDIVGGVYRCGIMASGCVPATVWSNTLDVITPPMITPLIGSSPYTVLEGNSFTISCNVQGGSYPIPNVSWYFQDGVVGGGGVTLSYSSITPSDGGNYTCVAVNSAGWTSVVIEIIVNATIIPPSSSSVVMTTTLVPTTSSAIAMDTTSTATSTPVTTTLSTSPSSSIISSTPLISSRTSSSSTSLSHIIIVSSSISATQSTTTIPPLVTSSLIVTTSSPSTTPTSSSDGPPFGDSWINFGVIIGFAAVILLLLIIFTLICFSLCCWRNNLSKRATANDKQKLIKEEKEKGGGAEKKQVDKSLEEGRGGERRSSSSVPKSKSFVNEGFKEEDGRGSEDEEEEVKVTIVTKEESTGDNFVVKMETINQQEEQLPPPEIIVTVNDEPSQSNEVVPPRDTIVPDVTTPEEQVYATVGLSVEQLQEIVLEHEVASLKGNESQSPLAKEFESIPMNLQSKSQWPEETLSKNRYRNVIPNNDTAVVLSGSGGDSYINANYIEGYKGASNAYISAQGPMYETMPDFWRMIWENKVTNIVMLCKIMEGGKNKCAKYWPSSDDNDMETYGVFVVRNNYEETFPSYKIVYLSVYSKNEDVSLERDVCLFLFQGWPDFGVPMDSTGLLQLHKAVGINHSSGPLLVHCSAGIGRTGTYINLDLNIQQYTSEGTLDPHGWTHKLRRQRGGMIQTVEQYCFLHTVLADYINKHPKEISFV